jgi:hypothetical protein
MHNEPFATPEGPDDLIVECESCGNLLYVRRQEGMVVSPCPLCGCLNSTELEVDEVLSGRLILKSPLMTMSKNSVEEGRITLPDLPDKVQEALLWLQENLWTFGFSLERPDRSEDA